jgi:hypothetical protein
MSCCVAFLFGMGAGALLRPTITACFPNVFERKKEPLLFSLNAMTRDTQLSSSLLGCRNPIVVKLADTERQKQQRRAQKQMTGMQYAFQPSMVRHVLRKRKTPCPQSGSSYAATFRLVTFPRHSPAFLPPVATASTTTPDMACRRTVVRIWPASLCEE